MRERERGRERGGGIERRSKRQRETERKGVGKWTGEIPRSPQGLN